MGRHYKSTVSAKVSAKQSRKKFGMLMDEDVKPSDLQVATVSKADRPKEPRYYSADDVPTPLPNNHVQNPTKLRESLVPGTVLILLAGRFRGKRVVFLKQLASGLLLVSGPFKVNGVPLRRVNQAFVVATTTRVNVDGMDFGVTDDVFKRPVQKEGSKFMAAETETKTVSAERKALQAKVDQQLLKALKATPVLRKYLNARFTLTRGQFPHMLRF